MNESVQAFRPGMLLLSKTDLGARFYAWTGEIVDGKVFVATQAQVRAAREQQAKAGDSWPVGDLMQPPWETDPIPGNPR